MTSRCCCCCVERGWEGCRETPGGHTAVVGSRAGTGRHAPLPGRARVRPVPRGTAKDQHHRERENISKGQLRSHILYTQKHHPETMAQIEAEEITHKHNQTEKQPLMHRKALLAKQPMQIGNCSSFNQYFKDTELSLRHTDKNCEVQLKEFSNR